MSGTCGPTLPAPSAFYDPESRCWRTSQGTFLSDSMPSSVTLPRWGMTRAGVLYELPTPALPTVAHECSSLLPTPAVNDMGAGKTPEAWDEWTARMQAKHGNGNGHGPSLSIEALRLLPTPAAHDSGNSPATHLRKKPGRSQVTSLQVITDHGLLSSGGRISPPLPNGEHVLGRPAPAPTEPGRDGPRLSPRFVEWLMGLPAGWVTDCGLPRTQQLKCLGNGVVPQQALLALRLLDQPAVERAS